MAKSSTVSSSSSSHPAVTSGKEKDVVTKSSSSNNILRIVLLLIVGPIYVLVRIVVANKMPLMDCDEVYNYWEPLHYILYGTGLQTWEYSNEYALRTYAYLLPLRYIAHYIYQPAIVQQPYRNYLYLMSQEILSIDQLPASTDKVLLFLLLRCTVAATTAICEFYWLYTLFQYQQQSNRTNKLSSSLVSTSTVLYTTLLTLSAAGMNHSAGAFLPSTTWMTTWCVCAGTFLQGNHILFAIIAITTTLGVGWPFGCVCVVPMAFHILYKEYNIGGTIQLIRYLLSLIVFTAIIQYTVMLIDEIYYGIRYISPTYNIFKYNAAGNGDELYGVEPISYYIKNLLLNFNFLALFGVITIPIILLYNYWYKRANTVATNGAGSGTSSSGLVDYNIISILLSLPIWFLITVPRPHKEERFMYPIYPVLVFGSVLSVQLIVRYLMIQQASAVTVSSGGICSICRFVYRLIKQGLLLHSQIIPVLVFGTCTTISIFRTMALYKYYTAPLVSYNKLAHQPVPTEAAVRSKYEYNINKFGYTDMKNYVCLCGEWYRFPSSFYLPETTQLGFLPSSFKGQLPQPFTKYGSLPDSVQYLQPFNDRNEHVAERYVNDTSMRYDCKWFVVLHSEDENTYCGWPYLYGKARIAFAPFLDAGNTKSTLHRTLYIPFGNYHDNARWAEQIDYDEYVIYAEYDNYEFKRLQQYQWIEEETSSNKGSNDNSQGEL